MGTLGSVHLRRALRSSAARTALTIAGLLAAYWIVPFEGRFGGSVAVRTGIGVVVLAAAIVWQLRSIPRSEHPRVRAALAVVVAASASALLFAALYRMASSSDAAAFNEPLDHVDALYLSMSVFTTVGFGDVHAVSSAARLLVTAHMIVNVVVLAGVARVAIALADRSRARA